MALPDFLKSKSIFLNIIIIIVALVVAINIYQNQVKEISSWQNQIEDEQSKQKIAEAISKLEKRLNLYTKQFPRRDASVFMSTISSIAKDSGVEIVSLKPGAEQVYPNYTKLEFSLTIKTSDYETLAKFVNKLEVCPDMYIIEN